MAHAFEKLHWSRDLEIEQYLTPQSLADALQMLADGGGRARVIAGGTDVVPELRRREHQGGILVDISRLPDLDGIAQEGEEIVLGARVTHAQAAASPLLREKAGLLAQGCAAVGSPQIRNLGTLGGNLVSGQPAADASIPLLALDATVSIASLEGEREVPLTEFFLDVGKTVLHPSREIMTHIRFQALGENQGSCYQRLSKRKALSLPMLVCAVVVKLDAAAKTIEEAAIALGPVAPVPFREVRTEESLRGVVASRPVIEEAANNASSWCSPRDSLLRGSCDYRQEMVKVLVQRGLLRALQQAGCTLD